MIIDIQDVTAKLVEFTTDSIITLDVMNKKIDSNVKESKIKLNKVEGKFDQKFLTLNSSIDSRVKENVKNEIQQFSGPMVDQGEKKNRNLTNDFFFPSNYYDSL